MPADFTGESVANFIDTAAGFPLPERAYPLTLVCWGYVPAAAGTGPKTLLWVGDETEGRDYFRLALSGGGASSRDKVRAGARNSGSESFSTHATQAARDGWFHGGAVFLGDTERYAYMNGVKASINTTSITIDAGQDVTVAVGVNRNSSPDDPMGGYLAHAAAWQADIGDAAMADLATGLHPLNIHADELLFYHSCDDRFGSDGTVPSTITGSAPFTGPLPPVAPFVPQFFIDFGSAAGGGFQAAWSGQANTGAGYGHVA